jgi:hypothetical protein
VEHANAMGKVQLDNLPVCLFTKDKRCKGWNKGKREDQVEGEIGGKQVRKREVKAI